MECCFSTLKWRVLFYTDSYLKPAELRVKWRETEEFGMIFWVYMCISRWEELQQNIFHVLCSFALLKYLRVISLQESISGDIWRERSLNPLDLAFVVSLFQDIFLIGKLSYFMALIGPRKSGARPELLCKSVQSCELWLEGVSYISLTEVYILH